MNLRNWEFFTITGNPVVGATVEVRDAVLTHPNVGTVLASTVTDVNGMYEFTGLAEGPKDVKLVYQGKIKWLKGMTRHSVSLTVGEDFVPADVNLLKNGSFESWRLTSFQLAQTDTPNALGWLGKIGAGDVGVVQRESVQIAASKSRYAVRITYTKSSGPLYFYQLLPPALTAQLRGQVVTVAVQARRGVNGSCQACIQDEGVDVLGPATSGVSAYGTLSVSDTIGPTTTQVYVGAKVNLTDDLYLDNIILVVGSVVPVFEPRVAGNDIDQVDYNMMDRAYARSFLMGAH